MNALWAVGLLALVSLCLPACDRELEVQQAYDFTLETMPVQKNLRRGETAEIRCSLKRAGRFAGARYTLRNFQSEGKGMLRLDKGPALKPNDRYPLAREEFRLYYTSQTLTRQAIDVYIEDNFGRVQQLSFFFQSQEDRGDKGCLNGSYCACCCIYSDSFLVDSIKDRILCMRDNGHV